MTGLNTNQKKNNDMTHRNSDEQTNFSEKVQESLAVFQATAEEYQPVVIKTKQDIEPSRKTERGLSEILPSQKQASVITETFKDMGADENILSDDEQYNRHEIQKYYRHMVLENKRFPTRLPIWWVLEQYKTAVIQGAIKKPYHNLTSIVASFKEFCDKNTNRLYEDAYRRWPELQPKQIASDVPKAPEETEEIKRKHIEMLKKQFGEEEYEKRWAKYYG